MPIQAPHWMEFLSCPICCHEFDCEVRSPVSLGCSHTVCRECLSKLQRNQCPYDQNIISLALDQLPVNSALLSLLSNDDPKSGDEVCKFVPSVIPPQFVHHYTSAIKHLNELALLLKPFANAGNGINGNVICVLSRPMQRKLVTLINCQLAEDEGRVRAVRAARSLGERSVTELILHHQNHHQLSSNLWAAVRSRGCQFLGPAMQEEVLKLVLLALEDGSALSRKVLVMFVVQRLEPHFPQASKTSIGHVVQLLYRASCFMVHKRESDSSLMQLKEEFCTYESLRREHDAQIVQIATEAGLRIAPDQWSSLLYGDMVHKSHMQSIMDKLQTPQSFCQSFQELVIALQRTGDPGHLFSLKEPLETLASVDPNQDLNDGAAAAPEWEMTEATLKAVKVVVLGLVKFIQNHGNRKLTDSSNHVHLGAKFKTSLCRDLTQKGGCPRGGDCTFAHTEDELSRFRIRSRKQMRNQSQNVSLKPQVEVESSNLSQLRSSGTNLGNWLSDQRQSYVHSKFQSKENKHTDHASLLSQIRASSPQLTNSTQTLRAPPVHLALLRPVCSKEMSSILKNGEPISQFVDSSEIHLPSPTPVCPSFQLTDSLPSVPPHSASLHIVTPVEGTTNLIRHPMTPLPSPRPPLFATVLPEYTYSMFHSQNPLLFTSPPVPTVASPILHTPIPGQLTSVFSPSILPEMIPSNSQPLLMNQNHHVMNVFAPHPGPTQPPVALSSPPWVDSSNLNFKVETPKFSNTADSNYLRDRIVTSEVENFTGKSLNELTERKEELLCRLTDIVGEKAMNEIATQIVKGEPLTTTTHDPFEYSSTYCIWTSGADFSEITRRKTLFNKEDKLLESLSRELTDEERRRRKSSNHSEKIIEEEALASTNSIFHSAFQQPSNPIQVSACNTTDSITTPIVYRPVPAISPMPQMLYQQMTAFVPVITPSIGAMNTIGHGIIDPPHLHMSQLDPSGMRPSDPISDFLPIEEEERQRQQFIAAKESGGRVVEGLSQKFEEMQIKAELNQIMQDISDKKKELRENNGIDDEEYDFEKNWRFDFEDGNQGGGDDDSSIQLSFCR